MSDKTHAYDAVHWHMVDITSRIIAESRIPSDRFHLGKIILQSLKDDPNLVAQVDGATDKSENNASLEKRSIQCAIGFKKMGLQSGDVMVLMAPNHLDLVVPLYAGLYEGIAIAPIYKDSEVGELKNTFEVVKPKIIICQSEKVDDIKQALVNAKLDAKIVTFDEGSDDTFSVLLKRGSDEEEIKNYSKKYEPTDIDPADTIAFLIATSGTTGLSKFVTGTHKNFAIMEPYFWLWSPEIPFIQRILVASPLQWLLAILIIIGSPFIKATRIQSSLPLTQEHLYHLINCYKPEFLIMSPIMMTTLLNSSKRDKCDFSCFKIIYLGGSAVHSDIISELKILSQETEVVNIYGMSELINIVFKHGYSSPPQSCGKPLSCLKYRLVDLETGADINEPNRNGELWIKGPGIFKGYYINPETTKEVFSEDDWFKTGDIMYRDESWNFYFVERITILIKSNAHQISPTELESVIVKHPGVLHVAVAGIPDQECGYLLVACIVRKRGHNVSAQEIKDLVKENFTETKHLRGGVVFFDQLPLTSSYKLHRKKIEEMALAIKRE